ncbi:MAG: ankyrin repeat domain-containing protein [Candidatus Bilamarchaeaceae archaeon]
MEKAREGCEKKGPRLKGPLVEPAAKPKLTEEQQKALNTQLLEAAKEGNTKEVEELLTKGVNVNAKNEYGTTALMWAAYRGNTETVEMLKKYGAKE